MPSQLFFATNQVYQPGQIISFPSAPHLNGAAASWLAMEQAFENARPATHHSRMTSRFACETVEDCLTYYLPQPGGMAGKVVYEVLADDPVAVPMALTGWGQHHQASAATLGAIAQEYWAQQLHAWEFLEYIAPQLQVVAQVLTQPDAMTLAASAFSYQNDRDRAKQLWP